MNRSELISVKEAAYVLYVSQVTMRKWMYEGFIPYVKIGGRSYLKPSDIYARIEEYRRFIPGTAYADNLI